MKTSLKKLRGLAAAKHDRKERKHHQPLALDELATAVQDMQDMRDCYDKFLSAAAAMANSVYEFSESLGEMGDCLLEKTALNDDEESGKVLLMLGKVQLELQKLVDGYRSHIFQTITIPSESLLNELRIVEEMKRRCDEKREVYEEMMKKYREKGKLRSSKGECFSSQQLQVAHDEYDEEANVFVFRMKSLKQGQSRSLLTQAARHHAAQFGFVKKAVKILEAIEPHVKFIAEKQHIDYQFNGLEDDDGGDDEDDDDDDDNEESDADNGTCSSEECSEADDDGELSFDYGHNGPAQGVSGLRNSMELDDAGTSFPSNRKIGTMKGSLERSPGRNSFSFHREVKTISKSAPLFPENKLDLTDRLAHMRSSPCRKFASYVLPTPDEAKSPDYGKSDSEVPHTSQPSMNLWHSSPLEHNKYRKLRANERLSGPILLNTQPVLKESNKNTKASQLPSPLSDNLSPKQFDVRIASDAKKVKRQAFSGPLTGKPWPNNPNFSSSGPIGLSGHPHPFSGSLLRTPMPRPSSSSKLASHTTHTFVSSPKISELHELPRPPVHLASGKPSNLTAHSGPLISNLSATNSSTISTAASTLPMPSQALTRCYSIPSGGQIEVNLHTPLAATQNSKMAEDIASPPLTPISLRNVQPASPTS